MTDETIKNDCERLFPTYDGMSEEQIKKVDNEREGASVMAKLKNNRFENVKIDVISNLSAIKETIQYAMEQYNNGLRGEDLKDALDSVIENIDRTSKTIEKETLGTENCELPF